MKNEVFAATLSSELGSDCWDWAGDACRNGDQRSTLWSLEQGWTNDSLIQYFWRWTCELRRSILYAISLHLDSYIHFQCWLILECLLFGLGYVSRSQKIYSVSQKGSIFVFVTTLSNFHQFW